MEMSAVKGWAAWTPVCAGATGVWVIPAGSGNPGEPHRVREAPQARYDCSRCSTQAYRCRSAWRFASIHASCLSAGR